MALQILLNLFVSLIWVLLSRSYTIKDAVIGYLVGMAVLFLLRGILSQDFYMRRVWAAIKLFFLFLVELTKANIDVVKLVWSPKLDNHTGIVAYNTDLETPAEITLLSIMVSLTPGTIPLDFSKDNKVIYIHVVDLDDKQDFKDDIRNTFEKAIKEVTR